MFSATHPNSAVWLKLSQFWPNLLLSKKKHTKYNYTPNESAAEKLKTALNKLLALLKADDEKNEKEEARLQKIFEAYKARLTKVIDKLKDNIKRTKAQIKKMKRCIRSEKLIITTAGKKFSRNDKLKKNAGKMCNSFAGEFIRATKNRLAIIKTIREILGIVAKRFKTLPKGLVIYLNKVEKGWIQYMNSTQFKKFVEYQRKHKKFNKRGHALANKLKLK